MNIIDAHLHLFPSEPHTDALALRAGHENSIAHLRHAYSENGIIGGVVMSNRSLDPAYHQYPSDLFRYCIGLDRSIISHAESTTNDVYDKLEANLQQNSCCGIKLYPGYQHISLTDNFFQPVYSLAKAYHKPVAIHMGLTSFPAAHLKYCHPLVLDEVAADHPDTQFIMCHFGNPFLDSATAALVKNPNVFADLSGLLDGPVDLDRYFQEQSGFAFLLKTWFAACSRWDALMFGTDWPLVNLTQYIDFICRLIPEMYWDKVFCQNARRIYSLPF